MSAIENLHNRIDLLNIPFTDRSSRIMLFRKGNELYIRLAERWEKSQDKMGHYRQRSPIISRFTLFDEMGNILNFDVESYPHLVRLITPKGLFDWIFTDSETLLLQFPPGKYSIQFVAQAEKGQIERRGGELRGIRNIAYTTNARVLTNEMSLLPDTGYQIKTTVEAREGNGFLLNITP